MVPCLKRIATSLLQQAQLNMKAKALVIQPSLKRRGAHLPILSLTAHNLKTFPTREASWSVGWTTVDSSYRREGMLVATGKPPTVVATPWQRPCFLMRPLGNAADCLSSFPTWSSAGPARPSGNGKTMVKNRLLCFIGLKVQTHEISTNFFA